MLVRILPGGGGTHITSGKASLYSINPNVAMRVSKVTRNKILPRRCSRKRGEWVARSMRGAAQGWNSPMEWMKFIALDTWREGRLKLKRRRNIGFIVASILEPQRASGPGACPYFRQRFDHSTKCERFANWLFIEFPFFRYAAERVRVHVVFDLHRGGVGL